jgi:hypothetical protein
LELCGNPVQVGRFCAANRHFKQIINIAAHYGFKALFVMVDCQGKSTLRIIRHTAIFSSISLSLIDMMSLNPVKGSGYFNLLDPFYRNKSNLTPFILVGLFATHSLCEHCGAPVSNWML